MVHPPVSTVKDKVLILIVFFFLRKDTKKQVTADLIWIRPTPVPDSCSYDPAVSDDIHEQHPDACLTFHSDSPALPFCSLH